VAYNQGQLIIEGGLHFFL